MGTLIKGKMATMGVLKEKNITSLRNFLCYTYAFFGYAG